MYSGESGTRWQPGYDHVIKLANCLVDLHNQEFVMQQKVDESVTLWDNLSKHDKGPSTTPLATVTES